MIASETSDSTLAMLPDEVGATRIRGRGIDEHLLMHNDGPPTREYYYVPQESHTVSAMTNASGNLVDAYTYDAYGQVSIFDRHGTPESASNVGNPYTFTGRRLDRFDSDLATPRLDLYHYRARAYTPVHGRFLQRDPSGYTDGMNLYEYVRSRPTVGVDPTGHKTVPCVTQGFDGPAVFPPFHDWLTNYDRFNTEIRDQGGFQVFGDHWLSRKGTNLFFRSGSSYSNWLDGTATIKQMKLDIGDSVKKQALGNARRVLKCEKRGDTCIVENLKKPFLESPGGYFGTDWLSTGNITVLSYSVCNIFKKCCVGGRNCTKTQANCHTVFVAHDSFHFGFPGKPFFWHAKLVSHYPRGTDYYGPGCKR